LEFKKDSEQSIVFIFEFPALAPLRSSFKKLQHRFEFQHSSIRENKDGTFQLRITRVMPYNEIIVNKHKSDLIEDLTYYNGKFVTIKVHKVALNGTLINKKISLFTKIYIFLSKGGGTRAYTKYKMPLFSVIILISLIFIFSVLKI
jgi:hypothetical protein